MKKERVKALKNRAYVKDHTERMIEAGYIRIHVWIPLHAKERVMKYIHRIRKESI